MPLFFSPSKNLSRYLVFLISLSVVAGVAGLLAQPSFLTHNNLDTSCETGSECFQLAMTGIDKIHGRAEMLSRSISELQQIQSRFPDSIWAKRVGIHLGLILTETEPEKAVEFFRLALHNFPIIEDYVRFWMGKAHLQAGQFREAIQVFDSLEELKLRSLLQNNALFMGAEAYSQSGDCESAVPRYRRALRENLEASLAPKALLNLGNCQLNLKKPQEARASFREIWWRFPATPEAETALTMLEQNHLNEKPGPTLEERYQRGLAFYNEASFADAVLELKKYLQDAPASPQYFEAQYKLGTAFARLKNYPEAEKVFLGLSNSHSRQAGIGTVWLGRVYLRQNKGSRLLALQDQSSFQKISGDQQALIHVFCGIWLEDEGKFDQAIKSFRRAVKIARSSERRLDALWRIGWRYYQLGNYSSAISTFKEMQTIQGTGKEHARASYWMARAMEPLGKKSEAQNLYKELAHSLPFTYYGQLAQSRLVKPISGFTTVTRGTTLTPSDPKESSRLERDRHYQKAGELIGLNLYQEAAEELHSLKSQFSWDRDALSRYLGLAQQAHAYDIGIRLSIKHFGGELNHGRIPRSSEIWSWAYPKGYIPTIQTHTAPGLDPYLVAGLIREESLYNPFAVSRVGALGLMQLMPGTANEVARQLGLGTLHREELFNAEANIYLGTTYVNELFHQFQGNMIHTVSAYNAGPDAVNRWIVRNGHKQPDEFVESISYRETRRYVKRVLGSYRVYRTLATDSCETGSLDTIC